MNKNLFYMLKEKSQLSMLLGTIFFSVIISTAVVQIAIIERKRKFNIAVKIHLPTILTKCWIPTIKSVNLINIINIYMSRNGSYPSCYPNILYEILNCGFPFYLTWFNSTLRSNLILYFSLSEGIISHLK